MSAACRSTRFDIEVILRVLPALPCFLFVMIAAAASSSQTEWTGESPVLLFIMNSVFLVIFPLVGAFFTGRVYTSTGSMPVFMLGCGLLSLAFSSLVAGWVRSLPGGANYTPTIHNLGALLSSLFHLRGVLFTLFPRVRSRHPSARRSRKLVGSYALIFAMVTLLTLLTVKGVTPMFFVQGEGPTLLRQMVLALAVTFFSVSAFILVQVYITRKVSFLFWYTLSLFLIAEGLGIILFQKALGSPINWVGRLYQYAGGVYLVIAVLDSLREARSKGESLTDSLPALVDAMELRKAERAFQESEARFRSYFDLPLVGTAMTSPDKGWIEVNEKLCSMLGYSKEELQRMTWSELTHPEDLPGDVERFNRVLAGEIDGYSMDKRFLHKSGEIVWSNLAVQCMRNDQGGVECFAALVQDITDCKRTGEMLASERALLKAIFDATPDFLVLKDRHSRYKLVNAAFCRFLGKPEAEIIGQTDFDLFPAEDAELYRSGDAAVMATLEPEVGDWQVAGREGMVWLQVIKTPILDEKAVVSGVLCSVRDVSGQKKVEQALRDSLEEKVVLLKEVHHRVKNNLQIVASLLSLQKNRSSNQEVADILLDTRNRVRSMALLHETLYRSGNLVCIDFPAYVKDLCGQLLLSYGSVVGRVEVEYRVCPIGLSLEQSIPCGLIIHELVSNAIKHGFPDDRSGKVTVNINRKAGKALALNVRDDGIGFPSGLNPTNTPTLGLRLVSRLAAQLRGQLRLYIADGGGTAVDVVFPVHDGTLLEGKP